LVQGGAGAVGYLAVQIARLEGARVLATVSDPAAVARLGVMGVEVIDRHGQDVSTWVEEMTGAVGVDRIIEVDFAANQQVDARAIKTNGTIASYSCSFNPRPVLDYYAFASRGTNLRFVQGFALPDAARNAGREWIAAHEIDIPIAATYALDQCADAHAAVENGGVFGQVVVKV
jgi:NADPH:quinone reductase